MVQSSVVGIPLQTVFVYPWFVSATRWLNRLNNIVFIHILKANGTAIARIMTQFFRHLVNAVMILTERLKCVRKFKATVTFDSTRQMKYFSALSVATAYVGAPLSTKCASLWKATTMKNTTNWFRINKYSPNFALVLLLFLCHVA